MHTIKNCLLSALAILGISLTSQAFAATPKMNCQVFQQNEPFSKIISFAPSSKMPRTMRLVDDLILRITWRSSQSPLKIQVERNPYYPWNLPWQMEVIESGVMDMSLSDGGPTVFTFAHVDNRLQLKCMKK